MKLLRIVGTLLLVNLTAVMASDTPAIAVVESATETETLLAKPGSYLGGKVTFEERHSGDVLVRIGVWEAGAGKLFIEDFPFTEYVLMISGRVVVTDKDGSSREFVAGDSFVIPRGWSGVWDVRERMKKQIVRVGSANLMTR